MSARHTTAIWFVLACGVYAVLMTNGQVFRGHAALVNYPEGGLNLVFNSMANSLLHGRFDVDPEIVGEEGFLIDGRVIAYWGLPFAIIRLPLAMFPRGFLWDVTGLSCLIAVSVAAFAKLKCLQLIFNKAHVAPEGAVYWLMVSTLLFSGAQIEFLKVSVYQEVCLWAGALGALFVYEVLAGLLGDAFSVSCLSRIAAIAGLGLLSRVSTGIGLYAAAGLLLWCLFVFDRDGLASPVERFFRSATMTPLLILLAFAGAAGFVNYERWGSPWVFADYHFYIQNLEHPDRLQRMAVYGLFSVDRVPMSSLYYLLPIWAWQSRAGGAFENLQARLYDFVELPPSTFILTDALLVGFAIYAIREWRPFPTGSPYRRRLALAVAIGLCSACALMLTAISMAHRYRIEFYPLLEFSGFVGVFLFLRKNSLLEISPAIPKYLMGTGAAISAAASAWTLLLYKLSPFGSVDGFGQAGFWVYYTARWHDQYARLIHSLN